MRQEKRQSEPGIDVKQLTAHMRKLLRMTWGSHEVVTLDRETVLDLFSVLASVQFERVPRQDP
jgi:hypothetical protein